MSGECQCLISDECGINEMTVKQIRYIKLISQYNELTFSELATVTNNSKPTITQMINKFINQGCVYKEKSCSDGRVSYIRLTKKGYMIANAEKQKSESLITQMMERLTQEEIDTLIRILNKL
jgi:DNA-binding MarR family transcriptional regulator